jgi:NAD(P)-dependent dehydrogenase (short-subunit alcohol dehydrogenase family)
VGSGVAVVTGASAGVGRATAVELGRQGRSVALLARGPVGLRAACEEVRAAGGEAMYVEVDMSDADAVEAAAERVEAELGEIDVWVNVAFTSVFAKFVDIESDEFRRVTDVNYHGYVNGTRSALKRMLPRDKGAVVQVGSTLAYRGIPLQSAYCGSKHAIQGFHESLRTELLHDGSHVRVTMVQLPALNTPQFSWVRSRLPHRAQPVPPIYQPEVAARTIVWAAEHPQRREYWVGETTAATLLANAVAPGLLDRYLGRTGVKSQQTGQPRDTNQPDNLWEPLDGEGGRDFGTHGDFGGRSKSRSPQAWASRHHGVLASAAGAVVGAGLVAGLSRRGR